MLNKMKSSTFAGTVQPIKVSTTAYPDESPIKFNEWAVHIKEQLMLLHKKLKIEKY